MSNEPLGEADIERFAMLFLPATPPATPTSASSLSTVVAERNARQRRSSSESDFGAFVSVPPTQDPLAGNGSSTTPVRTNNRSLIYFDEFTSHAKSAAERSKRDVLGELLNHQDDPMYFINTHYPAPPVPSTDDALAEALSSEMHTPKLIKRERGGSLRVAPSPSRSRVPLPPRLSGSASPPSVFAHTESSTSFSLSSSTHTSSSISTTASSPQPAHATLSRISSNLASLLPSRRPVSTAQASSFVSSSTSALHTRSSSFATTTLTHGTPFASAAYIAPSGAPGFAGDRAWDRGFSDVLERDGENGLVDPIGLGLDTGTGTEMTTHSRHGKVKVKGVTLMGRWEGTTRVLNEDIADLIRPHLPALTKLPRNWTLLYSLDQHGISLNTLYARSEPRLPSSAHPNPPKGGLLVIQDASDTIFGAWLSEGMRLEKGGYYGSGESFLWQYHPALDGERQGRLDVYKWTGKNDYVALCEPGFISFGGGDGHYGLYLDASLLDGSSAPCPTFGNPPLCGVSHLNKARTDVSFECVGLEVWGIGQGLS